MTTGACINPSLALAIGAAVLAGAFAPAQLIAGGVTAGTLIENTAIASYDDGAGPRTINSNTVTVRVDELLDLTLTSLDPGPVAARPGDAVLTFELTHQGNGPEAFRLSTIANVAGNDFDVTVNALAIDSNGNGVFDPGIDPVLPAPETTAVLVPDTVLTVFVLASVPEGISDAQRSAVDLVAEAVTGSGAAGTVFAGQGVDGGDAIVGTTGALATARGELLAGIATVELVKSVVLRDPFGGTAAVPGAVATFTIVARVNGSGTLSNLVITDAIPAGTTYAPGSLALDAAPLTDAEDGDAGSADQTVGVRVDLGTATTGNDRTVTFDVVINP
jgi:uncharacterized repeat protein (TIGR01451 family)